VSMETSGAASRPGTIANGRSVQLASVTVAEAAGNLTATGSYDINSPPSRWMPKGGRDLM